MSVTIKDIADHTGLAVSTISKYLNGGNLLPENKEKIQKAIDELKFSVNPFARSMKTNKSNIIGIIISYDCEHYATSLVISLQKRFMQAGYGAIIEFCDNTKESQGKCAEFLLSRNIDALIIFDMVIKMNSFHLYQEKPIPVLAIGQKPHNEKCDQIYFDDGVAVKSAIRFLLKTTQNIAYIGSNNNVSERYNGYKSAFEKMNIPVDDEMVFVGDNTPENGYSSAKKLLESEKEVNAVFVADGNVAVGVVMAIMEKGLKIPDDIGILTVEDNRIPKQIQEHFDMFTLQEEKICTVAVNTIINKICKNEDIYQSTLIPYEFYVGMNNP